MNADRRHIGHTLIALLAECSSTGLIGDESHLTATNALVYLQQQEFWQLRAQSKHAGKNASTDQQIAICHVAGAALDQAVAAWHADDFQTVIEMLHLAVTTDGTPPKKISKKGLRKTRT